ncbi:MAG TPA: sulfatase/phosphatase domain-containing protein, partial [Vicinamibacterales bacterium]|nr:sulfatase/phosphatase domain-containing protein [Vicinamibacterales bacterium]
LPALDKKLAGLAVGHGFALWEHLVRVPLIISGGGTPHAVVDDQVRHVDLLPTIAELAGLPAPDGIDGRSVMPLIQGGSLPDEPAYMEAVGVKLEGRRIVAARTPAWKLLQPGGGRPALYRLDGGQPPDEKRNVYAQHSDVARELETFIAKINAEGSAGDDSSGMSSEEEAIVEQHLRDLGYL